MKTSNRLNYTFYKILLYLILLHKRYKNNCLALFLEMRIVKTVIDKKIFQKGKL